MRYAQVVPFEVCNGKYAGVSVFVQGCGFHCDGCFNKETWDFSKGKEFTAETRDELMSSIDRPYIKRVSILGGEPLSPSNLPDVSNLITEIKSKFSDKALWLYTGYTMEHIVAAEGLGVSCSAQAGTDSLRKKVVDMCDVLVDGKFDINKRDITLKFRGSSNQIVWKKQNGVWIKWLT